MIKDLIEVIFKDFSRHNVSSSDQQFFNDMSQYGLKIQKSAIEYLIQTYFLTQKFLLAFDQKKFGISEIRLWQLYDSFFVMPPIVNAVQEKRYNKNSSVRLYSRFT